MRTCAHLCAPVRTCAHNIPKSSKLSKTCRQVAKWWKTCFQVVSQLNLCPKSVCAHTVRSSQYCVSIVGNAVNTVTTGAHNIPKLSKLSKTRRQVAKWWKTCFQVVSQLNLCPKSVCAHLFTFKQDSEMLTLFHCFFVGIK